LEDLLIRGNSRSVEALFGIKTSSSHLSAFTRVLVATVLTASGKIRLGQFLYFAVDR
jgi:hypothetical protein